MTFLCSDAIDVIFNVARSYRHFLDRSVSEELLRRIYDLAKMGPTTANSCPMRVVFLTTPAMKERLRPALRETSRARHSRGLAQSSDHMSRDQAD